MHHTFVTFPFAAIVGQDSMKEALLLNAVDPSIGGVLVRGDKGTGKSTAVRALASLLPSMAVVDRCPFNCHPSEPRLMCATCQETRSRGGSLPVRERKMELVELPVSATEDMVVCTLDITRALKEGIKALEPGILARANRNILYIDEVNLLDDHLVNVLLDAAAMGVNVVAREGISLHHPARLILVGTMNPEEGSLRPQILDRFGLSVEVAGLTDPAARLEIIERRRDFDKDPWAFEAEHEEQSAALSQAIVDAKARLGTMEVARPQLETIVRITTGLGIRTHRADIVMEKTAKALAALDGRGEITDADVTRAALLALPHRIRQLPFEDPEPLTDSRIEELLAEGDHDEAPPPEPTTRQGSLDEALVPLATAAGMRGKEAHHEQGTRGRHVASRASTTPRSVAVEATLRRTVRQTGTLEVLPEHLMEKVLVEQGEALYVIALDTSSSMRMAEKLRLTRTLSWQLLQRSYEKRSKVALVTFRDTAATTVVPPTSDHRLVDRALDEVLTGGKTPLTPALHQALLIASQATRAAPVVVLVSDGRANVFLQGSLEADLPLLAPLAEGVALAFVNAEPRHRSVGVLEELAKKLRASHHYLEDLL